MEQPQDFQAQRSKALWYAALELGFEQSGSRTILRHRKHFGPVRVQKMLWPEKTGVCHAIIVHPPAGIAGGDHLSFVIDVAENAHALVTTPGAGKWYKTNAKKAFQQINIRVKSDAVFEWLPQETMLFNGALAQTQTHIHLAESASFIGWEMLVIGRQARSENFETGHYHSQVKLWRDQKLLIADTLNFQGNDRWLKSPLGMNDCAVMGSLWAVAPSQYRKQNQLEQQIDLVRELIMRMDAPVTLTLLGDVVCARYLGSDARQCHDAFAAIRAKFRWYWFHLEEEFPRIWRT